MKYRLLLLLVVAGALLSILIGFSEREGTDASTIEVIYDKEHDIYQACVIGHGEKHTINSYHSNEEDRYYLFMPAFTAGIQITDLCGDDAPVAVPDIRIMYSENIPAVFIDLDPDGKTDSSWIYAAREYIHLDKENSLRGHMDVITADGRRNYAGDLSAVNGRGNSTWRDFRKRPYNFYTEEKASILGLRPGKKWTLLALAWEGTHLNTRVSLDIAEALDAPYVSGSEWIDLYMDGEYLGNYLLIEPVSVGDGRVPINDLEKWNVSNNENIEDSQPYSEADEKGYLLENGGNTDGGYLVEQVLYSRYDDQDCGFKTKDNEFFSVKAPKHASMAQVKFIKERFQRISDSIEAGTPDFTILDMDSAAANAVLQEVVLNKDAYEVSMFFYKEKGKERIYTGPVWDMDNTFGETNDAHDGRNFVNPKGGMPRNAIWYPTLMEDERFREEVLKKYKEIRPELEDIFRDRIDLYSDRIDASMHMDETRWELKRIHYPRGGQYLSYENNLRFFRWFYSSRVRYLYETYGMDIDIPGFEGDGTVHKIILKKDDAVIREFEVKDGELFGELPELDPDIYEGWFMEFNNVSYQSFLPVLEDAVIYAKRL
ncbi:MAG: CotH kinase family protein [Lachnospiraceae bacterium]|nr:CotH kinase family protein [Lachnospiraceae bacterium]